MNNKYLDKYTENRCILMKQYITTFTDNFHLNLVQLNQLSLSFFEKNCQNLRSESSNHCFLVPSFIGSRRSSNVGMMVSLRSERKAGSTCHSLKKGTVTRSTDYFFAI